MYLLLLFLLHRALVRSKRGEKTQETKAETETRSNPTDVSEVSKYSAEESEPESELSCSPAQSEEEEDQSSAI